MSKGRGGLQMRRGLALRRGRLLALLGAGFIGYLVGDMHAVTSRSGELNAAQNIALRFPESQTLAQSRADTAAVEAAADVTTGSANTAVLGESQVSLLSPERMVPLSVSAQPAPVQPAPVQVASAEQAAPLPAAAAAPIPRAAVAAAKAEVKTLAVRAKSELKTAADTVARRANRAGFVLNDAQIASIKARLHLTADQERMWPGVEAALRTIAYVKARDAQRHGGAAAADVAALNPDSAEVQGLKSAAVPLIMSFNDEQRSEVRNLAHVMGLDQLAAQF